MSLPDATLDELAFDERGLLPVIAQDADSGEVLTLAWVNRLALETTLRSGEAHYWSRSRGELWRKGATSGNVQPIVEVRLDCDGDAILYRVRPAGPACHTGERSCFHRTLAGSPSAAEGGGAGEIGIGAMMELIERIVDERFRDMPAGSYVTRLHERGIGYVAQKVVEEAGESVVAALQGDDDGLIGEAADLLFHLTVLLRERDIGLDRVARELAERHRERMAEEG